MSGHPLPKGDQCTQKPLETPGASADPSVNHPVTESAPAAQGANAEGAFNVTEEDIQKLQKESAAAEERAKKAKELRERVELASQLRSRIDELEAQIAEDHSVVGAFSPLSRSASLPSVNTQQRDPPPPTQSPRQQAAPSINAPRGTPQASGSAGNLAPGGAQLQACDALNVARSQHVPFSSFTAGNPEQQQSQTPREVLAASPYAQAMSGAPPPPVSASSNTGKLPEHFVFSKTGKASPDSLSMPSFFHGYARMLESMVEDASAMRERVILMRRLASLAVSHNWESVRAVYLVVCAEVEQGRRRWSDPLDDIAQHMLNQNTLLAAARTARQPNRAQSTEICRNHNNKEEGCKRAECRYRHICLYCFNLDGSINSEHRAYNCPRKPKSDKKSDK